MKTIAVIYYPSIHYTVKELNMALKNKEILEDRQLKPCNLWLPFDFHLYQDGLQYFPNQTELTEENISYLAHHQFSWLADYFEYDGIENVKNIIRNKGYMFQRLQELLPQCNIEQITDLGQENYNWIPYEQRQEYKNIYDQVKTEWSEQLRQDTIQKMNQCQDLLIVSFNSNKTYIDLYDILQDKNCYFIEPKENTYQSGINTVLEQYRYLHQFEPGANNVFQPNTEINEETATNNSFIQDNQDIWLNTPLQEKQKKIAHRL